ncbi:hypothetical protein [Achromobacter piechaudii]|uniref:KfrA N-terminal DNA-binding domain-containing protein n=1 Tax=Achromobacter piechaudii TaxID=72556 RepID=A0ABN7F5D4_9BURK|nr:hypothetical protein [Achromobacter piechaudii]CAB3731733.1 hypothetical protein LMG1873_04849 [Achromobacter piechaudii]CAB3909906.1 hypothetical protein LMG2828_04938 [Achromobacter piechaudii]CAB3954682.1 hypothetical protein LMG6103_04162 [Achromobacter piechaudii]
MPKTTTQADKDALLAKMEEDREALRRAAPRFSRSPSFGLAGAAWAKTTALTAGAALGWPSFLKKPLRAAAAVALRARFAELLERRNTRRVSGALPVSEVERLTGMIAELRAATARVQVAEASVGLEAEAQAQEIERLRTQLDEQVTRLRALQRKATVATVAAETAVAKAVAAETAKAVTTTAAMTTAGTAARGGTAATAAAQSAPTTVTAAIVAPAARVVEP